MFLILVAAGARLCRGHSRGGHLVSSRQRPFRCALSLGLQAHGPRPRLGPRTELHARHFRACGRSNRSDGHACVDRHHGNIRNRANVFKNSLFIFIFIIVFIFLFFLTFLIFFLLFFCFFLFFFSFLYLLLIGATQFGQFGSR